MNTVNKIIYLTFTGFLFISSNARAETLPATAYLELSTIFITHDIDEAILLSDRIYILNKIKPKFRILSYLFAIKLLASKSSKKTFRISKNSTIQTATVPMKIKNGMIWQIKKEKSLKQKHLKTCV